MSNFLEKWAEEMGINSILNLSNKKLTSSDYDMLTKGAGMQNIWKFVTKHVRDAQTVKVIRGNLALHGSSANTLATFERDMLETQKANLKREILALKTTLQSTEQKTLQSANDVLKSEQNIHKLQCRADNHRIATFMLRDFLENACSDSRKYTKKCKEVQQVLSTRAVGHNRETDPVLFARNMPGTSKTILETACMQSVRESCESIEHLLLAFAKEMHVSLKPNPLLSKKKKMLYKHCLTILTENAASEVLKCLNDLQDERNQILKQCIDKLDVKNDAKTLQFQYTSDSTNSECLRDLQSRPDVLKDIKVNVIVKFLNLKKIQDDITKLSARNSILLSTIQSNLQKIFPNEPEKMDLAWQMMESEMKNVFGKAYLQELENDENKLMKEIEKGRRMYQVMIAKYEDIKNLHRVTKVKQEIIRSIIASNAEYEHKLQDQIKIILELISKTIENYPTKLHSRLQSLQNTLSREVELFVSLPLSAIVLVQHGEHWSFSPYLNIMQFPIVEKFNEALGLTDNQPPENFLASAICLKRNAVQIQQVLKSQRDLLNQSLRSYSHSEPDKSEALTDLKKNVQSARKQQSQICDLSQQELKLDSGFGDCQKLHCAINIWEKLPAGEIVLPLTVAGINLNQFKENLLK